MCLTRGVSMKTRERSVFDCHEMIAYTHNP